MKKNSFSNSASSSSFRQIKTPDAPLGARRYFVPALLNSVAHEPDSLDQRPCQSTGTRRKFDHEGTDDGGISPPRRRRFSSDDSRSSIPSEEPGDYTPDGYIISK